MAAHAAGWRAESGVSSQSRDWRADVMVYDERRRPYMALEAQLSPMTADDARMRTIRYRRDGVGCAGSRQTAGPWQRSVPNLLVRPPKQLRGLEVWRGVPRYEWTHAL